MTGSTGSTAESRAFGERLRELRESLQLNRRQLANEIGVSPAYITYLELGVKGGQPTNPTNALVELICHKFGISYEWLKNGKGTMHSSIRQRILSKIWNVPDENLGELLKVIEKFIQDS